MINHYNDITYKMFHPLSNLIKKRNVFGKIIFKWLKFYFESDLKENGHFYMWYHYLMCEKLEIGLCEKNLKKRNCFFFQKYVCFRWNERSLHEKRDFLVKNEMS